MQLLPRHEAACRVFIAGKLPHAGRKTSALWGASVPACDGRTAAAPAAAAAAGDCRELGFRATLTTNGTLLPKKQEALLAAPALRKVSVSLHSFEANEAGDFSAYLTGCTAFAHAAQKAGVLADFRLWNLDGAQTKGLHDRNAEILERLHAAFPGVWKKNTWGWRLENGVFVSFGERFDWPDEQAEERGNSGYCRALFDQIAVLSDGTVVPCCLDHEGTLALGNLFRQELSDILASPLARAIREGFEKGERAAALCRRCGYAERFGSR